VRAPQKSQVAIPLAQSRPSAKQATAALDSIAEDGESSVDSDSPPGGSLSSSTSSSNKYSKIIDDFKRPSAPRSRRLSSPGTMIAAQLASGSMYEELTVINILKKILLLLLQTLWIRQPYACHVQLTADRDERVGITGQSDAWRNRFVSLLASSSTVQPDHGQGPCHPCCPLVPQQGAVVQPENSRKHTVACSRGG